MYFVFHAEIPAVWNEFACERRLVQSTFPCLVTICSQSICNRLLGMFSFVGTRTTVCASLRLWTGEGFEDNSYEIKKKAVFPASERMIKLLPYSLILIFVWHRRNLQFSCSRYALAVIFMTLLIAVTFVCLRCSPEKWAHAFVPGLPGASGLATEQLVLCLVSAQPCQCESAATETLIFYCKHSFVTFWIAN